MPAVTDYRFEGWVGKDDQATKGGLVFESFEPKAWDEDDIDVKVICCGICGSDVHALAGDWGALDPKKPVLCGHEIVGEIVKAGKQVSNGLKVGDKVGIGAQSDCCRECKWCLSGESQLCAKVTWTFDSPYHHGNAKIAESHSKGGFAKYWRGPASHAVKIPESLELTSVAPMFCGGITVYSPLEDFGAGTKAQRVGIIGIGGLGHYGVMFAKAMGAEVTAISRDRRKEQDARALGADRYIAMSDGTEGFERSLDLIICTINPDDLDLRPYLPLLDARATLVIVGISPQLSISCSALIGGNKSVAGSNIGSPDQIKRMLDLVVTHNIKSWTQLYDMKDINQAMIDFEKSGPRFRSVLVNKP